MSLLRATALLTLRRVQSVPNALYHANVSNFFKEKQNAL